MDRNTTSNGSNKLFTKTDQYESSVSRLTGQLQKALSLAQSSSHLSRREQPKSYILAKVLFFRRTYGTSWVFCDLIDVITSISSEKNLASKLQRIKPKLRIGKTFSDSVNLTKTTGAPSASRRQSPAADMKATSIRSSSACSMQSGSSSRAAQ